MPSADRERERQPVSDAFRQAVIDAMAKDRRRNWQWKAPDIEAELNSGLPIKPPSSQPNCGAQAESIAA